MSRLETRVKRLENAQGDAAPDMSGYDNWQDYRDHHWYLCSADGREVTSIFLFANCDEQFKFGTEEELWSLYPAGTKFMRSGGGNYEVIDGVMRKLNFPPSDGKLSPEVQAAIGWLFEEYPD